MKACARWPNRGSSTKRKQPPSARPSARRRPRWRWVRPAPTPSSWPCSRPSSAPVWVTMRSVPRCRHVHKESAMSTSSVGGCSPSQMQATQYSSKATTGASRPPPPPQGGGEFVSAIASALSALDVGAASSDGGSNSATGAAQALGDFLGSLMEALKSQGGQKAGQGAAPPPQGGLQTDLQSLIG